MLHGGGGGSSLHGGTRKGGARRRHRALWQAEAARTGEEGVSDQFGEEGLARTGEKSGAGMDRRKVGVWTGSGRWFFSS